MKAMIFEAFGGPEVLHLAEVAVPTPSPRQTLVRVRACGVNHLDIWMRSGTRSRSLPLPHILGSEIAGEVATVGVGGSDLPAGTAVAVAPWEFCGQCEYCLAGQETLCLKSNIIGIMDNGGYAEYVLAPTANLVPLPAGVDATAAAAVTLATLTAWNMLVSKARLVPGEDVLVLGGNSGVGSAAIQIARLLGARTVITTTGSAEKAEFARRLGATAVIDHYQQDIREEVRRITNKRGVDVVIEHVGAATWEKSVASLARGGRLVTCGATTGSEIKVDIWGLFARGQTIMGAYGGTRSELRRVLALVASKQLQPVIQEVLPLERLADAHRMMEAGNILGKLVITP